MKKELVQNQIKIRNTLLKLLLKKDINQIYVTDLAAAAKVSRSTFYLYYDSIYSVLQELEDEYFQALEVSENLGPSSKKLVNPFSFDVNTVQEYSALIAAMLGPHGSPVFRIKRENIIKKTFRANVPAAFVDSPYYQPLEANVVGARIQVEYCTAKSPTPENIHYMTYVAQLMSNHITSIIKDLPK